MKKLVLVIAVAALLVPTASTVAMQARIKQVRESAAKNAKALSEWTGSLMADVGRAIRKQDFNKIPDIIKRHKKKTAGIVGTAAVLTAVGLLVRMLKVDVSIEGLDPMPEIAAAAQEREREEREEREREEREEREARELLIGGESSNFLQIRQNQARDAFKAGRFDD